MKKQKKKSLQIVKRIVTLFLILAITSTQIEPSVFAAGSDEQWASESLKEDAVTENKSADATVDSTGTTNTDEDHTEESETEKKPETTENPAQNPGNTGTTDGTAQNPGNTDNTDKTEQDPGNAGTTDGTTQNPGNTGTTDGTAQDQDNTDNTDKTEQDPETTVTEEQLTEETDENLSASDAVLPVEISYYLPKFQELKIEAPEEYTDTEQQEEARAAVTDQAMADETTQKLLEQAEKDAESADADESALDTQALTESAVSEEEYVSYTQMAVTGDTLAAPAVSLPDDVQLDPEADPEDTDPLIGWQVAKLAGIVLSYADGTKINEGDVIPADQINEVSATAADDGIALLAVTPNMTTAELIALTQDMTVVQRVGAAGANGKWSILVQGGANQTETQGTVRHAYGTLAGALNAINIDKGSTSFKITLLDDYTADSTDIDALGKKYIGTTQVVSRTDQPTIVFTGAVNYDTSTSYQSWNTLTFPNSSSVYFSGYDPYFTRINIGGSGLSIYGNQNNTSFVDMKFVSGVEYLYGGRYDKNASTVNYTLTLDQITTTADAPIKKLYAGSFDNVTGDVTLKITNSEIYGNVYASGRSSKYTQTGNVTANLKNVSIYRYRTIQTGSADRIVAAKDMLFSINDTGGAFWGADGKVSGDVRVTFEGSYYAQYGTWFGTKDSSIGRTASFDFDITNEELKYVGNYRTKVGKYNYIYVDNTNLANVFGWDDLYLSGCNVAPEQHFGHMQYSSSFYGYWSNIKDYDSTSFVSSSYSPDLTTCSGDTYLKNTTKLNSTGQGYDNSWSRQCYKHIHLQDNTTQIYAGGQATTNSNTMRVDGFFYGDSYKARLMCSQTTATTAAAANIFLLFPNKSFVDDAMKYMSAYSVSGVPYTMVASDKYLKVYSSSATQYKVTLTNSSGTKIATGDDIATVLNTLANSSYATGTYTVNLSGPYTLTNADVDAFNTNKTYATRNNIVIQGTGTFVAGGNAQGSDTSSYRFARIYPNFKSLTWRNIIFRQDFRNNSASWYINANGHNMTFEDCTFTGPVSIDAGGNSTAGTSGSILKLKNCINVNYIYANRTSTSSILGYTIITVDSCGGYGTAGVTIDPASSGSVRGLAINVTDTPTTIKPGYTGNTSKITGNYVLNVTDSNVAFTTPVVNSSPYTATTNLKGNVVLTGTCTGRTNSDTSRGKAILNVYDTVKTQENVKAYLADFDTINVSGELRLGNYANSKDSGFSYSNVRPDVTLSGNGKLILERLGLSTYYRTIKSLTSTSTSTEISFPYIYNGTSDSLDGRTLIVQNALTVPTNGKLRVSTALIPYHTGTEEYPLIQFESLSDVNLNQYNWIADQRYYLKVGASNSYKIVLRPDTYAPMAYQRSTSDVTLNSDNSETRSISLYIQDYVRDAIDKKGISIRDASNNAYPSGLQVYLSTQDVQLKDGTYGYVYDSSKGDIQLDGSQNSYATTNWRTTGTYTNINGASITASTTSPVLSVSIKSRTYESFTNYFIYVRDVAGNWSKFLLDTQGPSMSSYGNVTSTRNDDGTFNYTFSNLKFEDVRQSASYGTSDISDLSYVSNASKFINTSRSISEVKYNTTGLDPWKNSGTNVSFDSSTGVCTLTNVKLTTDKLYIFAKDGYGNKSKYEFVPVTFDAQCGGEVPDGKLSNDDRYYSTLCQIQGRLTLSQIPSDPVLKNLGFRYWYKSTDTSKSDADIQRTPVTEAVVYYPLWSKPTVTISNQVEGNSSNKNQKFAYKITVKNKSGVSYGQSQVFKYTGGVISGVAGVAAPASGTASMNSQGYISYNGLTHGQSISIELPDYYDIVTVEQVKVNPYWTVYTTEGNQKYSGLTRDSFKMEAANKTVAYVNNSNQVQPVVYQVGMTTGKWSTSTGDDYSRRLNIYIQDIYGDGIDTSKVYLSTQDAVANGDSFDYRYATGDNSLNDVCSRTKYTAGSFKDINGNRIVASSSKPVYAYRGSKNLTFDSDKNYYIYVCDISGKWTKYLLDTRGPQLKNSGTISVSKSGSTYTYSITNMKFTDEIVNATTSALNNVNGVTTPANATKENSKVYNEIRYNTTGEDPFNGSSTSTLATGNNDGTFSITGVSIGASETLYIFAQDAYKNTVAIQYVPVTFDAKAADTIPQGQFTDGSEYYYTLGVLNGYLGTSQIPSNPKLNKLGFKYWYKSSDSSKTAVDFKKTQITGATTFYPVWEKPTVTISTQVAGNAADKNQTFNYTVDVFNASGVSYGRGQKYNVTSGVLEGTEATAPSYNGTITADSNGKVVLTLKHGQSVTLEMPDYYGRVNVAQRQVDPYTTTYAFTDGTGQPGNTDLTSIMKVTAINRSVAYTNTAIKSQPVVYQGKWEGKWNSTDGDSYNKKTTIYIRDLYGDGIDTNGSSFTEAEKAQFNWKGLRVQAYFSTFDAPKDSDGYNLIDANANFTPLENICVHSDDVEKLTSGTITDINGKEIPVSVDKPVWAISLTAGYKFDQNSNYFIYVHDQAGHWTKFLLDTKAPEMTAEGDISVSKSGDTYTCEISNMKFEDKVIEASTSALKNVEGFTYSANATKENSSIFDALRANTTGEDPFQYTSKNYWSTTKNADGTFTFSRPMNLKENQMLYIFAQDAYGNTTALQYVPVTFDATEGGAHSKTEFIDGTTIKSMLVRKGEKLIVDQIPEDPHFTEDTQQIFLGWYKSTDATKGYVNLLEYTINNGVTFYADYDTPGLTIRERVSGDAANKQQEFNYTVKFRGIDEGTKIECSSGAFENGVDSPQYSELTVDANGEINFSLKHGQQVTLYPGTLQYVVDYITQDESGYSVEYRKDGASLHEDSAAYNIEVDEIDVQVDVLNTKGVVVTGIDGGFAGKTLPIVGLAAAVVMLGASALMLKRRRRS